MKKSNPLNLLFGTALAITLIALAGCASKNYQKGSDTGSGLIDAASRITAGKAKIDAVLTPLNGLVSNPQGDLVAGFNKFNDAVSDLQSSAQDVKSRVTAMRANGNEYFKNWDQQLATIKNEDIKSRSSERKAAVQKQFMDIKRSYTAAEIAFGPFMSDLKDIQAALGTDLTAGGVAAIGGAAQKANQDADALKSSMDQLASQFNQLGVAMSAAARPPNRQPRNKSFLEFRASSPAREISNPKNNSLRHVRRGSGATTAKAALSGDESRTSRIAEIKKEADKINN